MVRKILHPLVHLFRLHGGDVVQEGLSFQPPCLLALLLPQFSVSQLGIVHLLLFLQSLQLSLQRMQLSCAVPQLKDQRLQDPRTNNTGTPHTLFLFFKHILIGIFQARTHIQFKHTHTHAHKHTQIYFKHTLLPIHLLCVFMHTHLTSQEHKKERERGAARKRERSSKKEREERKQHSNMSKEKKKISRKERVRERERVRWVRVK